MKRIIGFFLIVSVILLSVPTVSAADVVAEGSGGSVHWELNSEGVLRIYGDGELYYGYYNVPWKDYSEQIKELVFDEGITEIANNSSCFKYIDGRGGVTYPNLKKITFSKTVTYSGARLNNHSTMTFSGCPMVDTVEVDEENETLCAIDNVLYSKPNDVLNGTLLYYPPQKKEKQFVVPDRIAIFYMDDFHCGNTYLEEIVLSENTLIFDNAMEEATRWCGNLQRITADNSDYYITEDDILYSKDKSRVVFYPPNKKDTIVTLPDDVREIGEWAFNACENVDEIILPENLSRIRKSAFAKSGILRVTIPSEVKTIENSAFENCGRLMEVFFSGHVDKLSDSSFSGCSALDKIWFSGDAPNTIGNDAFKGITATAYYPKHNKTWIEDKMQDYGGTLTWEEWNPNASGEITQYSYSFSNSNSAFGYPSDYTIPLSSYQLIYGENVRAETVYLNKTYYNIATGSKRYWNGNCAGMTATSELLTDSTNGINPVNFNESAVKPKDLKAKDTNTELEIDLTTFIEAMHVAQYTQIFKNDRMSTVVVTQDINRGKNNLNEFHDAIKSETENGRPVLLAMIPGNGMGGHAILGYGVIDYSDGTSEILTYDNRRPMEELPLTLTKDENGDYTTWSYDMDKYGIWGTDAEASSISFVYYDTLMEIWKTRGNLAENNTTNLIAINSDSFSLYSSADEELAQVENGELVKNSDGIELMEKELSLRIENQPENMIIAPVGVYRVVNHDDSVEQLEVLVANEDLGASVNTTADEVIVSVQDSINSNSVTVCAEPKDTYEVTLKSTMDDNYNEIVVTGKGSEEDASISMVDGVLDVDDCDLSSLVVDGKDQGPYTISASAKTGGKISPSGEVRKLRGERQKYEITPNAGYMISDVLVDGKSIGAVSEYEFKNITKEHSIVAVFERTVLYGDANGDGKVDASDLTRLARHLAKIETIKDIEQFGNSDVNHDGKVDSDDLTKLARFIAKIIPSLE